MNREERTRARPAEKARAENAHVRERRERDARRRVRRRAQARLEEETDRRQRRPDRRRAEREDWKLDSQGTGSVNRDRFFRGMFNLADVWCDKVEARDYAVFLGILYQKCFDPDYGDRLPEEKEELEHRIHHVPRETRVAKKPAVAASPHR